MIFQEALKHIVDNWESIKDKQDVGYLKPQSIAVWCGRSDTAGSYEVDEEWIGVSHQGNIVWAYASGCSCWDGDFSEERFASLKEVTLHHGHTPEEWENVIIKFVETGVMQQM